MSGVSLARLSDSAQGRAAGLHEEAGSTAGATVGGAYLGPPAAERPLSSYSGNNSQGAVSRRKGYRVLVRVKRFPDGGRVAVASPLTASCGQSSSPSFVHQDARCQRAAEEEHSDGVSERHPEEGLEDPTGRSCLRAQARCKEAARAASLRRMATLTFPEAIRDYDKAYRLISGWLHHKGRKFFPEYVAVPELHPGGHGWHWHVLHARRLDPRNLFAFRESWTAYLLGRGYVLPDGASWVRVHLKHFTSPRLAAVYAAKYVGKTLGQGVPPGRQRYLRSEGLRQPEITEYLCRCLDDALNAFQGAGWFVIDGRDRGWGLFVWATTDPPWSPV